MLWYEGLEACLGAEYEGVYTEDLEEELKCDCVDVFEYGWVLVTLLTGDWYVGLLYGLTYVDAALLLCEYV